MEKMCLPSVQICQILFVVVISGIARYRHIANGVFVCVFIYIYIYRVSHSLPNPAFL